MDTKKLVEIMSELQNKISSSRMLTDKQKGKFASQIDKIRDEYNSLEITEPFEDLAKALEKRGGELLKEFKKTRNGRELADSINNYLRYVTASNYDFRGNIRGINHYTRFFILTAALFMALTPQFYGFVLPIIFVLPIFAGLRGIRKRSRTGLTMSIAVVPMAIMSSITWILYFFQVAMPNFDKTTSSTAQAWNVSTNVAQLLIIVPSALSVVLIITSLATVYLGYKYREMFV